MKQERKIIESVGSSAPFSGTMDLLHKNSVVHVKGAVGSLKSLLIANLFDRVAGQIIYFTSDHTEVEGIKEDLEQLIDESSVAFFPSSSFTGSGIHFSNQGVKGAQLGALQMLSDSRPGVVIAHHSALESDLPVASQFKQRRFSLSLNESFDFEKLIHILIDFGFVRESRVENPGEISVRGGIVDVYPFSEEFPYRIEFWGDEVESIRKFDPVSQRSSVQVNRIRLFPQDLESQTDGGSNILDYLAPPTLVIFDEPARIKKNLSEATASTSEHDLFDSSHTDPENSRWQDIETRAASFKQIRFVSLGERHTNLVDYNGRAQESFKGNLRLFRKTVQSLNKLDDHETPPAIYYLCDGPAQASRVSEIFTDEEISPPNLTVVPFALYKGFMFPAANLVMYTDHEFYGRSKRLRLPRKARPGLTPKQLRRLNLGDYVVHVDYGIGVFRGLKKITVSHHERECLHLEYKDGDKVYVKVERMDRVYKYSSKDGATPQLNKIGSPDWQKLKSKTKKKLKDIAKDLIQIYAKRKAQSGFSYSADTLWQRELEASFPYDDTPDQVKATLEVKADMESPKPMDRLVCGDVGFGKTEIAVRGAFKAVLSGKQVAMLVPTTILAHQHYNTFKERLERFPVHVEMLSRFRTQAEQKQIVEKLAMGEIDVVIGTHRLVSKDVKFKNLGLLIIDEEQRFGVRHKERLKKMRATVDVLTLTATPIPRTLQFSLMGVRDMTTIDTPPKNRLPIITEILPFNKHTIREAILRELDRDGQVFFVHNRVRSIERVAKMLSDLVPEADIAIAHGQMNEKELEKVVVEFMRKKFQILVCTMIIESGMDMPNVNTIIVNRADKLGLAQLYQLRGRVGRSHLRAYAYLLIPPVETLTEDAMKRLRAIEEFTELGSGTRLAFRDLEIRGAGNLLGAEQTGFINALGFEMYNKVLDEAVRELKSEAMPESEAQKPDLETQVDMDFDAFLPDDYITSGVERVDLYQRLIESTTVIELEEIRAELLDRFGRLPEPVTNLLNFLSMRIIGPALGMKSIQVLDDEMVAEFDMEFLNFEGEHFKIWLGSMVENASQPIEFFQNEAFGIRIQLRDEIEDRLLFIKEFLQSLTDIQMQQPREEIEAILLEETVD